VTSGEFLEAAPILGAIITGLFSINVLYFKWLLNSFSSLRDKIERTTSTTEKMLDQHEAKDQHRHEENLYRFEKISVALAKLGSTNGTHHR